MVAAQLHVHEAGDGVAGVGVAVVLDALDETAGAVPDAGDGDADPSAHVCPPLQGHAVSSIVGAALGGDERVDPLEVALGGRGLVLDEGTGVAVARQRLAAPGELVRQLVPPALEELQPGRRFEVAAEGELEGEGPVLVGARGRVGPEQLVEQGLAGGGDAVGLPGAAAAGAGAGGAGRRRPRRRSSRWPGWGSPRPGGGRRVDDLDGAHPLQPGQGRIERPVRHAPDVAEGVVEPLLQLVAVEGELLQEPQDRQFQHRPQGGRCSPSRQL